MASFDREKLQISRNNPVKGTQDDLIEEAVKTADEFKKRVRDDLSQSGSDKLSPAFEVYGTTEPYDFFKTINCSCGSKFALVKIKKKDIYPKAMRCPTCDHPILIDKHRQRLFRRFELHLKSLFQTKEKRLEGVILDFSPNGARIFLGEKLNANTTLRVLNDAFDAQASVMWLKKRPFLYDEYPYEMGLKFNSFRSKQKSIVVNKNA